MEKYFAIIMNCALFEGVKEAEGRTLLECLKAIRRGYQKNEFVFTAGDEAKAVGVVLSGSVNVWQEDYWGNRTILAHIAPGGLFGEAFSCAGVDRLPVSVVAAENAEVLLIDYRRIITTCPAACAFHMALSTNMLKLLAAKNIMLTQKMEILTRRTTRDRLLAYLSAQAVRAGQNRFRIPFDRQQLADYLSVERSAMSAELSRMQADGILRTHRSEFEL